MISKIYISYSKDEEITYCFWKYFFQVCGVWIEDNEINENWSGIRNDFPHLLILGTNDRSCILPREYPNCVYLVKRNSTFQNIRNREDIVTMDRWERNLGGFSKTLLKLLNQYDEVDYLQELLQIFMQEKLWGALWIFHEMAFQRKSSLDKIVEDSCDRVLHRIIKNSDEWHHKFMCLYCDYIKCGVSDSSLLKRTFESKKLLERCEELAKGYEWPPVLCVIAGKICALSQAEQKYALNYFRSVVSSEVNSDLLYNIGHIYEKSIGDYDKAMEYYKKAYMCDDKCFYALYKIAIYKENSGKWMEAFWGHNKIKSMLRNSNWQAATSMRKIEYYYKSSKRLIEISKENINDENLLNGYKKELDDWVKELKNGNMFSKTLFCMLGKEEGELIKNVILNEMHQKIFRNV